MKSKKINWISVIFMLAIVLIVLAGCAADDDDDDDTSSVTWTLVGSDDFDRADNTYSTANKDNMLGADWDAFADEIDDPNSMIEITNGQVEIRGDSGADYQTPLNDTIVKLEIELTTANIASLDTAGGDYNNSFGLYDNQTNTDMTGCPYTGGVVLKDGVYNTYIVEMLDTSGSNISVRASEEVTFLGNATTYELELIINDGNVTFSLENEAGESLSTLTYGGNSCTFRQPGFSMGYVDDVSFFFDNFEAYTGE